ncbi:MAG: bifunctional [glutamate--ammonia ligase]-adenylyl-L-tyrosine phosphorylase/[glutamate--ammonia-ligase] adenylyltransferase [Pseudomonadota bacterium]
MNPTGQQSAAFDALLQKTLRCSRYANRALDSDPALLDWLRKNYSTRCNHAEIQGLLQQSGHDLTDEAGLSNAMRKVRTQVMVKLILRDLNSLADLGEVMQAMTALAEVCVQLAQSCLMEALREQFGTPLGEASGIPQELLIIGMGKLGGCELNVSSDIDLIFVYPEDGETNGSRKLSNHEFFTRMGRRLINLISEHTGNGYVFRVDMRLRPYGDSGPLVMSFAALEEYLLSQGREWERYAWIKARVIAPADCPQIADLTQLVQPFVFRKYLDFGAIDSMRNLHAQIRQEVQRSDRLNNIKLGPGGIREIEFTAQVFQLIRAGREPKLRFRPTRRVLKQLMENGHLSAQIAADLDAAYVFLRNLEHRLQYLDDQQTQELPEKDEDKKVIAEAMGYPGHSALMEDLNRHRALVSLQFEQIFGVQQAEQESAQLWRESITTEELNEQLEELGYRDASGSVLRLQQLRAGNRYRQLPELSKQRLDKLVPQFITLSAQHSDPDGTLSRLLAMLDVISRRAAYLAFLAEYPLALQRLTTLVAASTWASEYLTLHPALLDELLAAREIYQEPDWRQIGYDLQSRLDDCAGDAERILDVLRQVQHEQTFHLLAMDLQGLLPLETLSDHLSDLADLMLHHVLRLSWETARKRHRDKAKFAIVAYGKLGGKELGYASDLDLIFLYDDNHPDAQENYARLGQRINTMLSSYTSSGRLYEVDLRLRPNGESGLLVSSISAFAEYQLRHAWVWEHQALTRARFSAGDSEVGEAFEQIRKEVLCQPRELGTLRAEILAMRRKMHDGHPNDSGLFDIKHDSGGMVDIEFMVQYIVLAYAHRYPGLTANIGNLALLKLTGELGLVPVDIAGKTGMVYRTLRQTQHRMRLNNLSPCRIKHGEIETGACRELWEILFGLALPRDEAQEH